MLDQPKDGPVDADQSVPAVGTNGKDFMEKIISRDGRVILAWPSQPGRTYRVQYKNDLNAPAWTDLGRDITATDSTLSTVDETSACVGQRFYRLTETSARP